MQKILILAANPQNTTRLRLDEEVREIQDALQRSKNSEQFEFKILPAPRLRDFRRSMLEFKPDIVHFSGHGEGEEGIIIEDPHGKAKFLNAEVLSQFFQLFTGRLKCVIMNACYSAQQARAIARHIDYVVGMYQAIPDEMAIEYSIAFYDMLGNGASIEDACKKAAPMAGMPSKFTPKLLKKLKLASILLYYDQADESLIESVANTVCQRGIVPYYNHAISISSEGFIEALQQEFEQHVVLCPVFSPKTLVSKNRIAQLTESLRLKNDYPERLFPLFYGRAEELPQEISATKLAFIDPDADRLETIAKVVENLAGSVYAFLGFRESTNIHIAIDQRGKNSRREAYQFPQKFSKLCQLPTLVFRPDLAERTVTETLVGEEWQYFRNTMEQSLALALGPSGPERTIHISGDGQLGIFYALGRLFERKDMVPLYCYNDRLNLRFSNKDQIWHTTPTDGDPDCETCRADDPSNRLLPEKIRPGEPCPNIALFVGNEKQLKDVSDFVKPTAYRLAFVKTNLFKSDDNQAVLKLVNDIGALLTRYKNHNDTETVQFFTTLPCVVIPIVAANLTYPIHSIDFMEFRRDIPTKGQQSEGVEVWKKQIEKLKLALKSTVVGSPEEAEIKKQLETFKIKQQSLASQSGVEMYAHLRMS